VVARRPSLAAKLEEALGGTCWWQGDLEGMTPRYREALEIWQTLDDEAELANAYYNASFTYSTNVGFGPADGDGDQTGLLYLERARDIFRRLGRQARRGQRALGPRQLPLLPQVPRQRRGAVPRDTDDLRRGRRPDDGGMGTAHARDVAAAQRARRRSAVNIAHAIRHFHACGDASGLTLTFDDMSCRRGRGWRPAAGGSAPGRRPQPDGRDRRGAGGLRRGHVRDRGTTGRACRPDRARRARPLRGRRCGLDHRRGDGICPRGSDPVAPNACTRRSIVA
jgi:hypothetical protein